MPHFAYTALDARGAEKTGLLEAPDVRQVAAILHGQGLFPTEVGQVTATSAKPRKAARTAAVETKAPAKAAGTGLNLELRLPFTRIVKPNELAVFTRQLSTLLRAGMPLLRGLEVLARQERNQAFRRVIAALAEAIKSGGTLSEAMTQHPRVFDRLYINMVKAGEAGGVLAVVLDRLARFQEKSLQLKGKITAAMVYPLILLPSPLLTLH